MTFEEWWLENTRNEIPFDGYSRASRIWQAATLAERDRCISACHKTSEIMMAGPDMRDARLRAEGAYECVKAIRARGDKEGG